MNLLADRHHAGLLYSLQLLFEDRLDIDIYVPVGHEWWDAGYWRFGTVFGDDRLAQQYLSLSDWDDAGPKGLHVTWDVEFPEREIMGVSLDFARQIDWDFVMPSVQENQSGYHRFAQEMEARYLVQVGNTGQQVDWSLDPLAIISAEAPIPDGARAVRYHQEYDKDGLFAFAEDKSYRLIRSFVNCFDRINPQWEGFLYLESLLKDSFEFRVHGHDGRDGLVQPTSAVAAHMRHAGFGYHDKPQGDGFGHIIHYWASIGRPLLGHACHYRGRLAEPLWEDGVTAVCFDGKTPEQVAAEIIGIADDGERHAAMCRSIRARVDELIDFGREAEEIAALLGL